MKTFTIKKGAKIRKVYVPSGTEHRLLSYLKNELDWLYLKMGVPDCVHGFWHGRSPKTNAAAHVNFQYSLAFDLQDFFDSLLINEFKRWDYQTYSVLRSLGRHKLIFYQGAPRQGLCTSPVVSNMMMHKFDLAFSRAMAAQGVVYTRYADDITLSFNDKGKVIALTWTLKHNLPRFLQINEKKTKLLEAKAGRRIITGVSVAEDIRGSYKHRRKMRADFHKDKPHAAGWVAWCTSLVQKSSVQVIPVVSEYGVRQFQAEVNGLKEVRRTYKAAVTAVNQAACQILRGGITF